MFDKIYFSSGGIYALYIHIGAINELYTEYNKSNSKLSRNIIYYGNSIGSLASLVCYLITYNLIKIDKLYEISRIIETLDIINFGFTTILCLLDHIFEYCPSDLHTRISNIIHIGVTNRNGHKYISQFKTNADIYHVILCSMTMPGLSTYDSKIEGETCIDGEFSFNYSYIPADTMIVRSRVLSPLSLTIPPLFIQQILIGIGKHTIVYYVNNTKSAIEYNYGKMNKIHKKSILTNILDTNGWLLVHHLTYKNPLWKSHIESKTKSKISNDI